MGECAHTFVPVRLSGPCHTRVLCLIPRRNQVSFGVIAMHPLQTAECIASFGSPHWRARAQLELGAAERTHWALRHGIGNRQDRGRDVLEGGEGGLAGTPSSQGPLMVPAEGGPKNFKRKSSWHRRRLSRKFGCQPQTLEGEEGGKGGTPPPTVYGTSNTSLDRGTDGMTKKLLLMHGSVWWLANRFT